MALFTGPHGVSAPLGEFERVLMVASGFGIVAQLPYLRQLIRGYNGFTTRTLVDGKKMLSGPKERKKGGKMLVIGKAPCPVDHNDLLMDTEVSGSQEIRDDLRRLVRGYLDNGLSLLEMDYQPNK